MERVSAATAELKRGVVAWRIKGIDLEEVKWDRLAKRFWQQYAIG